MIRLNVHEAKTHLSRYLNRVEAGETLVLCRRNRPIAEVRPFSEAPRQRQRQFGLDEGKFTIPPEFFEPLPAEILRFFTGETGSSLDPLLAGRLPFPDAGLSGHRAWSRHPHSG